MSPIIIQTSQNLQGVDMELFLVGCNFKELRPSFDIVLSPHRTQFHLARCLARSKHGCNYSHCTQLIILRLSSVISVTLARCIN